MNPHRRGEVSERLKELASKASVGEILPWVRIPPSPPYFLMARNKRSYAPNENFLQKISTEWEEALLS